jgi:hypothetical protein
MIMNSWWLFPTAVLLLGSCLSGVVMLRPKAENFAAGLFVVTPALLGLEAATIIALGHLL